MNAETLSNHLGSLLVEARDALIVDGASPPPDRQYVGHGTITWDCDLLAAHLVRLVPQPQDARAGNCVVIHRADMMVTLLRCVPKPDERGNPPSADVLDAAYRDLAVDGWAMWKGLTRAWTEGTWPAGVPCRLVKFSGMEPLAPSGGLAGWRIDVSVNLR